jgi:hypothetical protein
MKFWGTHFRTYKAPHLLRCRILMLRFLHLSHLVLTVALILSSCSSIPISEDWQRSAWSEVKPSGPVQATIDSALDPQWKNSAVKWVEITVPQGTTIYRGAVARVGHLVGGGSQVYILGIIPKNWISNRGAF